MNGRSISRSIERRDRKQEGLEGEELSIGEKSTHKTTLETVQKEQQQQQQKQQQQEQQKAYDNELLEKIAAKSKVEIPDSLIMEEMQRMEEEEKRNLTYRGQTWQEHLKDEGATEEEHLEKQRPNALLRVKGGLILGEISDKENITVTPEEFEMRMQLLKGQYTDPAMQAELDKAESRRDIMSRMLTEKTLTKLAEYAQK